MAEYISREEAIKELREVYEHEYPTASGDFDEYASHDVPNVLRNMKSADVQPLKRGNWNNGHCSSCGEDIASRLDTWTNVQSFKFCPNCGARMIKDGEQND